MHTLIDTFLTDNYRADPASRLKVKQVFDEFRNELAADHHNQWPRWRFIAELSKAYKLGEDANGVLHVAGLADGAAPAWEVDAAGRLVKQ